MSRSSVACALATVGPLGRLPVAGTWDSIVGLLLGFAGLAVPGTPWLLLILAATFPLCAVVCASAERYLAQHDPPSVILDEVWPSKKVPGTFSCE